MTPILSFGRHTLNQIETGITKEWLETNGLGSYAMGTTVGANTRRHHTLFMMTSPENLKRFVLVNRVEESVLVNGRRVDCGCQEYPASISPQGHLYLESFSFDPFPRWVYAIDDIKIEKTFFLRSGEETAVLNYKQLIGPPVKLILRPFFSCRDHLSQIREDQRFKNAVQIQANKIFCAVDGTPHFFTTVLGDGTATDQEIKIYADGYWYKNLVYAQEEEMETDYQEDLFSPGQILADLAPQRQVTLLFSDQEKQNFDVNHWMEQELKVRRKILENFPIQGTFAKRCALAADQFLIRAKSGTKILRGYPWQADTMREALMSLPGICLSTGRAEEARHILSACARLIHQGLLPSRFPDSGPAEYNNVDASLWFVWAVQKYWESIKDDHFMNEMKPAIEKILKSFQEGIKDPDPKNPIEIRMDSDGLIWANSNRYPLTWMDGQVHDWIATPRKGKAVEIQALWYNALQFGSEIFLKFEGKDLGWAELAKKTRENFNALFWNSQNNYLYDVIDGNLREGSIRPNALYAISLPYEILETEKFRTIIETAWKTLYTSFGLRTLAPQEPHYHGIFKGNERYRAAAGHNGTVFPFLIGSFITAFFKTFGREQKNKEQAILFLLPFVAHLSDGGLGTISEMFDGNSPHNPRGCVAEAVSVAEILRVMKEEGLEL